MMNASLNAFEITSKEHKVTVNISYILRGK